MVSSSSLSKDSSEKSEEDDYRVSSYRWVILLAFMVVSITNQMIWITYAPITEVSASYYGTTLSRILLFAASFMIVYIPVNYPACWLIDKYGLKWGVGIGVILNGVFGLLRAYVGPNFGWALFCQIMVAIGQPFILNSYTKMAVTWFPESEKATASGLALISTFLGSILGMILPGTISDFNLYTLLVSYGWTAFLAMIFFLVVVKEKPEFYPNPYADKTKVFVTVGMKDLFKVRDFNYFMLITFIGVGAFNAITSKIDYIFDPSWDSGMISGVMIIGAVLGAAILSTISDKLHKRKIFLNIAFVAGVIFGILMGAVNNYTAVLIMAGIFGFFLVSALPVGLTYAAEITYPIPEESSAGIALMMGQISGLLFLLIPDNIFLYTIGGLFGVALIASIIIEDTEVHEKRRRAQADNSASDNPD